MTRVKSFISSSNTVTFTTARILMKYRNRLYMREGGREWGREGVRERERERDTILEGGSCFFQDGSHVSESLSSLLLSVSWRELHRLQRFHDCYCNYPETLVICESFILSGERYFNANLRHSSLQKIANFPKRVCLMVKICLSCLGKGHFQCPPRCPYSEVSLYILLSCSVWKGSGRRKRSSPEPADDHLCLLRAGNGKKHISTVVSAREVTKFQMVSGREGEKVTGNVCYSY